MADNGIKLVSFLEEEIVDDTSESDDDMHATAVPSISKIISKLGIIDFINDRLVAPLDRCKVNDRDAVHIKIATVDALGHGTRNLVINRTSIRLRR